MAVTVYVSVFVFLCIAAFRGILNNPTKAVRDTLINQCAQILACYRKNCASPSSAGQVLKTQHTVTLSGIPSVKQSSHNEDPVLHFTKCQRFLRLVFVFLKNNPCTQKLYKYQSVSDKVMKQCLYTYFHIIKCHFMYLHP